MNDYIIAIDRYGQPYIAHAWGGSKPHKYVAKVELGGGKVRYFYTQEEYNAYLRGKTETKDSQEPSKAETIAKSILEANPVYNATRQIGETVKNDKPRLAESIASKEKKVKQKYNAKRVKYVSPGVYNVDGIMTLVYDD